MHVRVCVCVHVCVQVAVRFIDSTSLVYTHTHSCLHLWLCKARSSQLEFKFKAAGASQQSGKKGFNSASVCVLFWVCAHLSLCVRVCVRCPQGLITFILFSRVSCFINDAQDKTHLLYARHTL